MEGYVPVQGSRGYEEVSATSSTAVGLTVNNINNAGSDGLASIQVSSFPVAIKANGAAPTSATVKTCAIGESITLTGYTEMKNFQAIGIGGTAVLAVQYYHKLP